MKIFGMGGFELVIILIVILIIFGPKNLPKLGKALGNTMSSLREGINSGKKKDKDKDKGKGKEIELEGADSGEASAEPVDVIDDAEGEADAEEATGQAVRADMLAEDSADDFVSYPDDEPSDAAAPEDVAAPASDAAEAPQKKVVKRVVKRKVATAEPTDAE